MIPPQETEAVDSEFKVILILREFQNSLDYIDPASRKKGGSKGAHGRVHRISGIEVRLEGLCECAARVRGERFLF